MTGDGEGGDGQDRAGILQEVVRQCELMDELELDRSKVFCAGHTECARVCLGLSRVLGSSELEQTVGVPGGLRKGRGEGPDYALTDCMGGGLWGSSHSPILSLAIYLAPGGGAGDIECVSHRVHTISRSWPWASGFPQSMGKRITLVPSSTVEVRRWAQIIQEEVVSPLGRRKSQE